MYQISNITNEFNTHEQPTGSDTKPSLAVVLSHCVPSPPLLVSISPLLPIALSLQISHFQILSPGFSKREFLQRSTFAPDVASFRGEELGDHGAENHDEEEPNSNMWSAEDPIKSARKYIGRGFFFSNYKCKKPPGYSRNQQVSYTLGMRAILIYQLYDDDLAEDRAKLTAGGGDAMAGAAVAGWKGFCRDL